MQITSRPFGTTASGIPTTAWRVLAPSGMALEVIDYGATITSLRVPDTAGVSHEVTLGLLDLVSYETETNFMGATVGRYANRISRGRFTLDGMEYDLAQNDRGHHLHGGPTGFGRQVWIGEEFQDSFGAGVTFGLVSHHGHEGFPGTVSVQVSFRIDEQDRLSIHYAASTDRPTVLNLTNHAYFNLAGGGGGGGGTVLDHELHVAADHWIPVTPKGIPFAGLTSVEGSVMDLRQSTRIGDVLANDTVQLRDMGGLDHTWAFNRPGTDGPPQVTLRDPQSGRAMAIRTTKPGVQVYTGNHLTGIHAPQTGICLETQFFPDSPNRPEFPSPILQPDDTYEHTTQFSFDVP